MAGLARELVPTYGGFVIGPANQCHVQGDQERYKIHRGQPACFFTCEFMVVLASPSGVVATDNAAFGVLCAAVEAALRKANQILTVVLGATSLANVNPSSGSRTGYEVRGEVEKVGGEDDTGRTRRYRFTCTWKQIVDLSGRNNRMFEASTEIQTPITARRVLVASAGWTASSSATALARYESDGDTYFATILANHANVTNGEWVLVDVTPRYDDENAELVVARTYWEVVSGLREQTVEVARGPNRVRYVTIEGMYTKTASATALANYNAGIGTLTTNILAAVGVTVFEAVPIAETHRYGTTEEQYFFRRTMAEIIAPQSLAGNDDPNIVEFQLTVSERTPFVPRTIMGAARPQQLRMYEAFYEASINKDVTTDLKGVWTSAVRAHAVNQVQVKLGTTSLALEDQTVRFDVPNNKIMAMLSFTGRGSDVLSLVVSERITRTGARNPRPRGDGEPHSYFLFKKAPMKLLSRTATIEYVAGAFTPDPFPPGETASGLTLTDTKQRIDQALDALERGELPPVPGWLALEGNSTPSPVSRGENADFDTIVLVHNEEWLYVAKLEQAPVVVPA